MNPAKDETEDQAAGSEGWSTREELEQMADADLAILAMDELGLSDEDVEASERGDVINWIITTGHERDPEDWYSRDTLESLGDAELRRIAMEEAYHSGGEVKAMSLPELIENIYRSFGSEDAPNVYTLNILDGLTPLTRFLESCADWPIGISGGPGNGRLWSCKMETRSTTSPEEGRAKGSSCGRLRCTT